MVLSGAVQCRSAEPQFTDACKLLQCFIYNIKDMAFTRLLFHVGASFGARQACRFVFVALEHSVRKFYPLSRFPFFLSAGGGDATTPSSSQTKAICLGLVTSLSCAFLRVGAPYGPQNFCRFAFFTCYICLHTFSSLLCFLHFLQCWKGPRYSAVLEPNRHC